MRVEGDGVKHVFRFLFPGNKNRSLAKIKMTVLKHQNYIKQKTVKSSKVHSEFPSNKKFPIKKYSSAIGRN
jgi:hypothetical protein